MPSPHHETALKLAEDLIRCPSVTPKHAGVYDVLERELSALGFECTIKTFEAEGLEPVTNLFATKGTGHPHFCYAGHVDVVPVGDEAAWTSPPFEPTIRDKSLYGRGASDMKGSVAAFIASTKRFIKAYGQFNGRLSLLIAGDEEDPLIAGTKHMLHWMDGEKLIPDMCLVGEPTNPKILGEMIKIGRRGSMNGHLTVRGTQGHVAYPHLADNPVPKMIEVLSAINAIEFDQGSDFFQPTNLEVVSVDTGNKATNVIPAEVTAKFNVRFNDRHKSQDIINTIARVADKVGHPYRVEYQISGESFLTEPGALSDLVRNAVKRVTGRVPELTTTGGTSDARYISQYCPVVEFGGVGESMHKVDENMRISDLNDLSDIYFEVLKDVYNVA